MFILKTYRYNNLYKLYKITEMVQDMGGYPIQAFKSLPDIGRYPIPGLDARVSIPANQSTGNKRISYFFSRYDDLLPL